MSSIHPDLSSPIKNEGGAILAWHFVGDRLRNGKEVPADGELLEHTGPLVLCSSGLHASVKIIDALRYGFGSTICRVECGDPIVVISDKLTAASRTILWRVDGSRILEEFARWCALQATNEWSCPDIIYDYLKDRSDEKWEAAKNEAFLMGIYSGHPAAWAAYRAIRFIDSPHEAAGGSFYFSYKAGGTTMEMFNTKLEAMVYAAHERSLI